MTENAPDAADLFDSATETAIDIGTSIAAAATSPIVVKSATKGFSLLRRYKFALIGPLVGYLAWRVWSSSDDDTSTDQTK